MTRIGLYLALLGLALGGTAAVADALVETDEERLEAVARGLTNDDSERRVDSLLAWTDAEEAPVSIRSSSHRATVTQHDDRQLADELHEVLASLDDAHDVEVVQESIEVHSARAEVRLRLRADGDILNLQLGFEHNEGFLLDSVSTY